MILFEAAGVKPAEVEGSEVQVCVQPSLIGSVPYKRSLLDQARHLAAMRIQQMSRQKVAKRRVAARKRDKDIQQGSGPEYSGEDKSAAAALQRVQRGKMARRRCRRLARETARLEEPFAYSASHEAAAISIQAGQRAKKSRRRVEELRASNDVAASS